LRQLVAEGKISSETPAWHQGLTGWLPLGTVLAALPPPPVASVPLPGAPLPAQGAPAPKKVSGCLIAAIITGCVAFVGFFGLCVLAGIALGPITKGIERAKEMAAVPSARAIELAMSAYADDHGGIYPDGKTSTEVFQKLLDGKYVTDPAIFFLSMPGKTKATSNQLTADNVCYDVTCGVTVASSNALPVVFSTGYIVTYATGTAATPENGAPTPFAGMAVAYKGNSAQFLRSLPDGSVPQLISASFDAGAQTYQQLKP
jgi:hypothetical protein